MLVALNERLVPILEIDGAGVSVTDDNGNLRFVTATSDDLVVVERAQEAAQEGPCADTLRSCSPTSANDLTTDERWPTYRPVALEAGFHAAAAVPLRSQEACIGSLDLYSAPTRIWNDDDIRIAALFSDMAASYLVNASDLARSERTREQLQEALNSRIIIEQAKGLIAGQSGVSVDDAYKLLRDYTRSHNARLHDVAHAVVRLGLTLS
jgi:GAF domain-containing protein